jgi:tetratricopeptide (TPR) repeat protein
MREFVDRFEGIREQVQAKPGTKCWNSIKLDKEFFSNALNLDYLLRVQRSYYDELINSIIERIKAQVPDQPELAWQTFLTEYTDALVNWCSIVYNKLCDHNFGFDEQKRERIETFKKLNRYVLFEKWVNALPLFDALTKETVLSKYQLSCLHVTVGQIILYWMPDMEECIPYFEKAKELCPENSKAVRCMGEYHLRKQQYEKARAIFLNSTSLDPNDTENYTYIADSYKDERKLETAEQWYKDAININLLATTSIGSLMQLYGQPEWYDEKKHLIEPLLLQAQAIERNLDTENSLYNRYRDAGHAHFAASNYEEARKYYEKAQELRPDLVSAKLDLAYTCSYLKDFEQAEKWLDGSLDPTDETMNFDTYWAYALLYEQMNASEPSEKYRNKSIDYYERSMALRPELNDVIYNAIGLLYADAADYAKAIPFYVKALEIKAQQVYVDNFKETLSKLTDLSVADVNTKDDFILNETGNFFYGKGEFEKAKQCYLRAIEQKETPIYFENLGLANEKLLLPEEAEAAYKRSIELDTKSGNSFNRLGVFYYNQMQDDKAIVFYKKALEREPTNVTYLQNLGYAYESSLQYEAAKNVYDQMLAADPDNDNVYYRLAVIAMNDKKYDEAISPINEALKIQPHNIAYLKAAGTANENLNNYTEALNIYERALSLHEDDEYFYNRMGIVYYRMNTADAFPKAIENYKNAIKTNEEANGASIPNVLCAVYWQNLALAYADAGDHESAEKNYLHSLTVDPNTAENYNNVGSFYFNKKQDWSNAKEMYEQAVKLSPNDMLYLRNLAASYQQLGEYQAADELYAKADELEKQVQAQPQ